MSTIVRDPEPWARAFYLDERIARHRELRPIGDVATGRARWERWSRETSRLAENDLRIRVEVTRTKVAELIEVLGCSARELVRPVEPAPAWWPTPGAAPDRATPKGPCDSWPETWMLGLLARAQDHICARIEREIPLPGRPWRRASLEDLVRQTAPLGLLWETVHRVLALELRVRKLRGELRGSTPEERFRHFGTILATARGTAALYAEYPVLARVVETTAELWVSSCVELFRRLQSDGRVLRGAFGGAPFGPLVAVHAGCGDLHAGHRSVTILGFEGGRRLVYKPRSLSTELHYQQVLEWLNAGLPEEARLRPLIVSERGKYGWMEHAQSAACRDEGELQRFHVRLGGLVALLGVLRGTDCHQENLIASGEHPVLVDLECLFTPALYSHSDLEGGHLGDADDFVSVLRSGLLPQWTGDSLAQARDISGIGSGAGTTAEVGLLLEGWGTDECCVRRGQVPAPDAHNRPTLLGRACAPHDYEEHIVRGFRLIHERVLADREGFLRGPLERFRGDMVRLLLGTTRKYALVLADSLHPDCLGNALERERVLSRLWLGIGRQPYRAATVPSELEDLRQGDVPLFSIRTDGCTILDSKGRSFPGLVQRSAFEVARDHVLELSEEDLPRHLWAIRSSLWASRLNRGDVPAVTHHKAEVESPGAGASRAEILDGARAIAKRLAALSYRGRKSSWWANLVCRDGIWSVQIMDPALGDGLAGVALFLGHLRIVAGIEEFAELEQQARFALRYTLIEETRLVEQTVRIGADDGLGGILYALARLQQLEPSMDWSAEAAIVLRSLGSILDTRRASGDPAQLCGALGGLLAWRTGSLEAEALELAQRCALSLQGLLHDGLALAPRASLPAVPALLELAALTDTSSFRSTAHELSAGAGGALHPEAEPCWLRGAAQLALLEPAETSHALAPLWRAEAGSSCSFVPSLHEGLLARLDLRIEAVRRLGLQHEVRARQLATAVLRLLPDLLRSDDHGPVGLHEGLAGVGYMLLRTAFPQGTPSVLSLGSGPQLEGS